MKKKLIIWITVFVIVFGALWFWWLYNRKDSNGIYRTEKVDRGDIVEEVTASGTLNPVTLVNVGTQISGIIQKIYVDYNSIVTEGEVLAEIDPTLLKAKLMISQGKLNAAIANLGLKKLDYERALELKKDDFTSQADVDKKQEEYLTAKAEIDVNEAQVEFDKANLNYATIKSPVSGVVVDRTVDLGQTVAASFQTPTLFQIAQDLKEMQIITNVSEADIGALKPGQRVEFTVDAYPDRKYVGKVGEIRLNPATVQNVVTYNVVVDVDNSDGSLLPGMTAFASVIIEERKDVIRVPNTALQFRPREAKKDVTEGVFEKNQATVYLFKTGKLLRTPVKTGLRDNRYTEIVSGDVVVGDEVVVEELFERKKTSSIMRL